MYRRSNGAVATIRCRGTLGKSSSCCRQCTQFLIDCCIWLTNHPSHQKHSCSNDKVWLWPWWPASLCHLFKAVTWWALGTTNGSKSLVLPLDIECKYKDPWWIVKFWWFHRISWPSSLEAWFTRSAFKSVFFCAPTQSKTALSAGSSLWTLAQSITCICTCAWHAVTHTSCWVSTWCATPNVTPLRIDFTMSRFSWVITLLSMSATMLSCPFWYSSSKLNCARAPTHQWPVASRIGSSLCKLMGCYLSLPGRVDRAGTPWNVL